MNCQSESNNRSASPTAILLFLFTEAGGRVAIAEKSPYRYRTKERNMKKKANNKTGIDIGEEIQKIKKTKALSEFSHFILRGNVIDLAVGIIIGGAFNKIVSSLVDDVLTPVLSVFMSSANFGQMKIPLSFLSIDPVPTINIGLFIASVINFIIMGFVVFCLVKTINRIRKTAENLLPNKEDASAPNEKDCPYCFSKINIAATRCPFCTSEIAAEDAVAEG